MLSLAAVFARAPFYYGWVLVGLSFVTSAIGFGVRATFGVFFVALLEEFHWPRGDVALILAINSIFWALGSPLAGGLLDRFGARAVFPGAAGLMALGLLLSANGQALWQFYLFWGVLAALGFSALPMTQQAVVLATWFPSRRGLVNGIGAAGVGAGILVLVPLAQYVTSAFGWRTALVGLAGLLLGLVALPNLLLQRRRPADLGLVVERPSRTTRTARAGSSGPTLRQALRSPRLYVLAVGLFCGALPLHLLLVHQLAAMVDAGVGKEAAANLYGVSGLLGAVLMVLGGWISDRLGREQSYAVGSASLLLAVVLLLALPTLGGSWPLLALYALAFGCGLASRQGLHAAMVGDIFRGPSFGLISGLLSGWLAIGSGVGPWLGGYLFDLTGSYAVPLVLAAVSIVVAAISVWIAAPRRGWGA